MKNKYEIFISNIFNNNILMCLICKNSLTILNHELICTNNHVFTISKKGTLFLVNSSNFKNSLIYNTTLFKNRRQFINKNYYNLVYDEIAKFINSMSKNNINILDLGSGEGTHMHKILERVNKNWNLISIDYSRDAINLATDYTENNICIIGDINNLPLIDKSIDVVVDFLSPFNNEEVKRVLKDNGIIIKITPGNKYLNELRHVLKFEDYTKKEEIKLNFMKYFDIINEKEISKKYSITEEDTNNLLMMSPLKKQFKNQKIHIDEITIDNVIYVGVCKNEKE